jgi:hypothetical protein
MITRQQFIRAFTHRRNQANPGSTAPEIAAIADAPKDALKLWRRHRLVYMRWDLQRIAGDKDYKP